MWLKCQYTVISQVKGDVMDDFSVLNTYMALCGRTIMSLAINKGVPARMSTSRSSTTRAEVSFAGYG